MKPPFDDHSAQSIYDLWLGVIPMFFGQLGVALPGGDKTASPHKTTTEGPASAHGSASSAMPGAMQDFARAYAPMMKAADPSAWLGPWAAAVPSLAGAATTPIGGGDATSATQTMFGPWAALLAPFAGGPIHPDPAASPASGAMGMFGPWMAALPAMPGAQGGIADAGSGIRAAGMQTLQQAQQSWLDFATRLGALSPQSYVTGFDRTFGGLFDALGFGPLRKLQTVYQELAAAELAQNQSRATYAMLVQGAFTSGLERLMVQLAKMADAGERVDSVLALLRMWAVNTEQAVHEVLQSEQGLAATAALTRAGLTHRRKMQHIASIVADALDLATRRELDDAYREIHDLKREFRALRQAAPRAPAMPAKRRGRTVKRMSK